MNVKNYFTLIICLLFFKTHAQPPSYVPTNGLVAWYGLGNTTDSSPNNNTLTAFNVTASADRFGNTNAAYTFNGTSSYLTKTTISNTFTQAGSFSVSIWVKRINNNGGNVFIMSGSTASSNFIWNIQSGSTISMFGTNKQNSSWFWANASTNYVVNNWEHYVGVYTANTMTFYRNGVLQSTTANTHTNVSSASLPLWIGRGIGGNYFSGSLDDIGIWNRALTANEIAILYNSTLSVTDINAKKLKLYPNPAANTLVFEIESENINKKYEIIDKLGRIVTTGTTLATTNQVDVNALSNGLYFLKLEGFAPQKFMKK